MTNLSLALVLWPTITFGGEMIAIIVALVILVAAILTTAYWLWREFDSLSTFDSDDDDT